MSLTIELTGAVEDRVREAADARGVSPHLIAENAIRNGFGLERLPPLASWSEEDLLARLNEGLAAEIWQEYRRLRQRRGELTDGEHSELIALSDQIEAWGVYRMELAAELGRRRGVTMREMMRRLGLLREADG